MNRHLHWNLLLALLVAAPTHAATWIKDFQGQAEDYRLERNGLILPVRYYLDLKTGDRLSVKPERELRLERDDGNVLVINPSNSPYTVQDKDTGQAPGVLANLVAWAGGWLHAQDEDGTAQPVVSLNTRNQNVPITLPLAPVSPIRLMAGERSLHLAWTGGESPFQVRLASADGKTVLLDQKVEKWRFNSPPLNLTPGVYQLAIQDQQHQATRTVEVVVAAALPTPAARWTVSTGADSLQETVYAAWLAAQGEPWLLEAYQRAALWQDRHEPAKSLMYSLENGARPTPPVKSN